MTNVSRNNSGAVPIVSGSKRTLNNNNNNRRKRVAVTKSCIMDVQLDIDYSAERRIVQRIEKIISLVTTPFFFVLLLVPLLVLVPIESAVQVMGLYIVSSLSVFVVSRIYINDIVYGDDDNVDGLEEELGEEAEEDDESGAKPSSVAAASSRAHDTVPATWSSGVIARNPNPFEQVPFNVCKSENEKVDLDNNDIDVNLLCTLANIVSPFKNDAEDEEDEEDKKVTLTCSVCIGDEENDDADEEEEEHEDEHEHEDGGAIFDRREVSQCQSTPLTVNGFLTRVQKGRDLICGFPGLFGYDSPTLHHIIRGGEFDTRIVPLNIDPKEQGNNAVVRAVRAILDSCGSGLNGVIFDTIRTAPADKSSKHTPVTPARFHPDFLVSVSVSNLNPDTEISLVTSATGLTGTSFTNIDTAVADEKGNVRFELISIERPFAMFASDKPLFVTNTQNGTNVTVSAQWIQLSSRFHDALVTAGIVEIGKEGSTRSVARDIVFRYLGNIVGKIDTYYRTFSWMRANVTEFDSNARSFRYGSRIVQFSPPKPHCPSETTSETTSAADATDTTVTLAPAAVTGTIVGTVVGGNVNNDSSSATIDSVLSSSTTAGDNGTITTNTTTVASSSSISDTDVQNTDEDGNASSTFGEGGDEGDVDQKDDRPSNAVTMIGADGSEEEEEEEETDISTTIVNDSENDAEKSVTVHV